MFAIMLCVCGGGGQKHETGSTCREGTISGAVCHIIQTESGSTFSSGAVLPRKLVHVLSVDQQPIE